MDALPPTLKKAFAQQFENHIQYQVGTIPCGTPKQFHGKEPIIQLAELAQKPMFAEKPPGQAPE
ncbi:hypothetical protein GBA52_022964 [Prunus armeniaca]|nr:hypothetical protein GBA52_022964 [Prunus armeniaca]